MRTSLVVLLASFLAGCAASGTEYARTYDRKYNETRLVQKESAGSFVGTSAISQPVRAPGQHP
jgi:hypothetical protein